MFTSIPAASPRVQWHDCNLFPRYRPTPTRTLVSFSASNVFVFLQNSRRSGPDKLSDLKEHLSRKSNNHLKHKNKYQEKQ
jgi:hypothetical protein